MSRRQWRLHRRPGGAGAPLLKTFLYLSRDAINDVVSLDTLRGTPDRVLFEACVRWANFELHELGNENLSDEEIRVMLGSILYKIRFPSMTLKEVAEITTHSKILSAEEKARRICLYGSRREAGNFEVFVE